MNNKEEDEEGERREREGEWSTIVHHQQSKRGMNEGCSEGCNMGTRASHILSVKRIIDEIT